MCSLLQISPSTLCMPFGSSSSFRPAPISTHQQLSAFVFVCWTDTLCRVHTQTTHPKLALLPSRKELQAGTFSSGTLPHFFTTTNLKNLWRSSKMDFQVISVKLKLNVSCNEKPIKIPMNNHYQTLIYKCLALLWGCVHHRRRSPMATCARKCEMKPWK